MKGLSNLMEETVLHKIDQIWQETDYCKCDKCKMDIAAYALNSSAAPLCTKQRRGDAS